MVGSSRWMVRVSPGLYMSFSLCYCNEARSRRATSFQCVHAIKYNSSKVGGCVPGEAKRDDEGGTGAVIVVFLDML